MHIFIIVILCPKLLSEPESGRQIRLFKMKFRGISFGCGEEVRL